MNKAKQLAEECQARNKSYDFYCHHCNQQMVTPVDDREYANIGESIEK